MGSYIQVVNRDDGIAKPPEEGEILNPKTATDALIEELSRGKNKKYVRFVMAALGSVPWVGSYLSILGAIAGLSGEADQDKVNGLLKLWLEEHQPKLDELKQTLGDIMERLDGLGEETQQRIESPEYLALVRRSFRSWDEADTAEKREYIKRLMINAGATKLCPDDLIRIFISWIDNYHESHFAVIKQISQSSEGITRAAIWDKLNGGVRAREDSAEAGLFRYLMRELNIGGVIELSKQRDAYGRAYRVTSAGTPRGMASKVVESTYEDTKPWILTELGRQFIHYVLSDAVKRVDR